MATIFDPSNPLLPIIVIAAGLLLLSGVLAIAMCVVSGRNERVTAAVFADLREPYDWARDYRCTVCSRLNCHRHGAIQHNHPDL